MISNPIANASATAAADAARTLPKAPGGKLGKDEFLKLLVAQMGNQDPLNPMDGMQFASQLAQFSSVEQLIGLNSKLDEQAAAQESILGAVNGSAALAAFGRTVTAIGNQVNHVPGTPTRVTFDVEAGGGTGTLKITNASGAVVGSVPLNNLRGGKHTVDLSDRLKDLPPGAYSYQVELKDAEGAAVKTQTYMSGRVDGIRYTQDGPVLTAGGMIIPFGSILEIVSER